jgi:hypothetical protein
MAFFYGPRTRKVAVAVIDERHITGGWEAIFMAASATERRKARPASDLGV